MNTRGLALLFFGFSFLGTASAASGPPPTVPVAFAQSDRLVVIKETQLPEVPEMYVSPGTFLAWREGARSFSSLGALTSETFNLEGGGDPLRVSGALVSVNLFATLGVQPALGRDFEGGDDAPEKTDVVILGHDLWSRRFGGRADALGKKVTLDGRALTIVGIMPSGLDGPFAADVYRPLVYPAPIRKARAPHVIAFVIGRLKPSATVEQAQRDVGSISAALAAAGRSIEHRWGARVIPLREELATLEGPRATPRGFDPADAATVSLTFARDRYAKVEQRALLAERLVDSIAKIPGVTTAAAASALPLSENEWINGFEIEGSPASPDFPLGTTFSVTPGYFEVLRIPLLRGRDFNARDVASAPPVAIISARAAKRWPTGVDPLGKRIRLYGSTRWLEVVGVVGEVTLAGQHANLPTQVYEPFAQQPAGAVSLVIRPMGDRAALAERVRAVVRGIDPAQSTSQLRPFVETIVATAGPH